MLGNGNTRFFQRYKGKRFRKRDGRRALAAILCACMLAPSCIDAIQARALEGTGLCEHHPVHDEMCGYQEAQEARPCTHTHDRECGYTPASEGTACDMGCPVMHAEGCSYRLYEEEIPCDMGCVDEDGDGIIDHAEGCAYRPAVEEIPCDMDCPVEHLEGCAYTPATEGTPCGHVHDENCGYQEEREEQPCTFECAVCAAADKQEEETGTTPVLEWQWIDEQEMLTWDETAQAWTLALIGAGEENPVTREMLAEFLPHAVEAKLEENSGEDPETLVEESTEPPAAETEGRMETLQITWDLSAFPEGEVYEGSYSLSALLPEGCMLAENAPALAVTVQLGGAEMYDLPTLLTEEQLKSHIVQGIDPAGTTVNLFDYWVAHAAPSPSTNGDILTKEPNTHPREVKVPASFSGSNQWGHGINLLTRTERTTPHLLKFGDGVVHAGLWNKGAGEGTEYGKKYAGMEGIVKPVLDKDGYPVVDTTKARERLIGDQSKRDWTLIEDWKLAAEQEEKNASDTVTYETLNDNVQNISESVLNTWLANPANSIEAGESLGYLFSKWPDSTCKKRYLNAKGLFQLDNEGYYYYDMRKNFAEYNEDTGRFILFDSPATLRSDGGTDSVGNFFPFNKGTQVFSGINNDEGFPLESKVPCSGRNATAENLYGPYGYFMNHHLGMTVTTEFRQPADGMVSTGTEGKKPMTFEFSGDDDVWVFIDDVLVLDLGGVHSELYGTIDFSNGNIYIGRSFYEKKIPENPADPAIMVTHTTLKEQFKKAGKVNEVRWRDDTFASESDHTLKMFYLERGNYDSSLAIRFNLQPRLEHEVKKVDQNGVPVKDVEFNLYPAAEGTGEDAILCTNAKDASASGSKYVVQTGENVLATLKTDENGIGNFIDSSIKNGDGGDVPFNFADFYDPDRSQGQYYILKEQNAPQGYRMLPIPIVLEYDKDTSLLTVANRWTTGAHASFVSHISGNENITYGAYNTETGNVEIDLDKKVSETAQKNGLAVAVPMLKQKDDNAWEPIYGNNLEGLFTVDCPADNVNEWRTAALEAVLYQSALLAQAQAEGDKTVTADWHLVWNEDEKHLEGTLTDLPGNALRYRMNNPAQPEKADMRMEYALITPEALEEVIGAENAKETDHHKKYIALGNAVRSHGGTLDEAVDAVAEQIMAVVDSSTGSGRGFSFLNVDQFNRSFRSQIYIPNEQRELRVLKVDQDGKAVNGAEFTLYSDEDCMQAAAHGTTNTVDGQDGMLIFAPYVDNSLGHATMKWENASNTQYYLKETKAPTGCKTNNTVIPVIVGTYSIYADAGTPEDGVTVMAGVGKLTQTMHKYASENAIDVTLRDISAFAQTQPSGTFRLDGWKDMKLENTDLERDMNLHYGKNAVIDYGLHDVDGGKNYKPYFVTDSGFIRARVEQNAAALGGGMYGESITTNWDNLGKTDITSLFSLLNTVVVTNQTDPDSLTGQLEISKRLQGEGLADADYKKNFKFQVTLTDAGGVALPGKYYFYGTDKTGYVSSGDILPLHHDESITILGLPVGAKYQVTEEQEGGWHVIKPASGTADGTIENDITADAEFINSRQDIPPTGKGSLTVKKTVTGNQGDKNKLFTFDISLGDNTLNGTYGEITFTNGKAVITLKDGEQKTAENLPAKITYMVTEREANQDGYTTSSQNTAGTIPADGNSTAAFTNNKSGGGNTPGGGGSDKPDPPRDPDPPKEPEDPEEPVIPEQPEEPVIPEQPEEPVSPDVPELPDTPQELSSTPDGPDDLSIYDDGVPRDGRDRENSKYPGLPQTGIVWRTVLLIAAAGVLLLAAGAAQNRKDRNGKR